MGAIVNDAFKAVCNRADELEAENNKLRAVIKNAFEAGHDIDCIFCGLKDKELIIVASEAKKGEE